MVGYRRSYYGAIQNKNAADVAGILMSVHDYRRVEDLQSSKRLEEKE